MQIKVFTIPVTSPWAMEEEANKFLRSHRVMTVDRQFTEEGGGYWTLFVTYQDSQVGATGSAQSEKKVDYREVLSTDEFVRFARYRDLRKELARQQGIPAYAIFTDEEMAQIARMEEVTIPAIAAIKGVGKRAEKYGQHFISAGTAEAESLKSMD